MKYETKSFKSETQQLLHLMINSLYSNKEIFVRELISNASDAIEKLRFHILSKPDLCEHDDIFIIKIIIDKDNGIIKFIDNGIGMNKDEVIGNLGTIAKSGTKEFIKLCKNKDFNKNNYIGQFGVGFYSAFIVSDKIIVHTKSVFNNNNGILWKSKGKGNYIISECIKNNRGTEISLYLRDNEKKFLDFDFVKNIVIKYSEHISVPVEISTIINNNINKSEKVNKGIAFWARNKSNITDSEYKQFYKNITHDYEDPLLWMHNHVEGNQEYISLLYISKKLPFDIWHNNKSGIKLYVNRMFIMDNNEVFMPKYLRFIKGIVDSSNLSLNISREVLQDNHIVKSLKKSLTRKILSKLNNLANSDLNKYQIFWNTFGIILKEGLVEDVINKDKIADLLRFSSSKSNVEEQVVSLKEYVSKMIDNQDKIYYISSDSYITAKNNPHLEFFNKKNIEVLFLYDRIDEWMISYLPEYNDRKLQSINKFDESLNKLDEVNIKKLEKYQNVLTPVIKKIKNILFDYIKDVRITNRLINSPSVLVTDSNDMNTQMVKLLASTGQKVPDIKYIFEINPNHDLIKKLINIKENSRFIELVKLLFDQAMLIEYGSLREPSSFIKRINNFLLNKL
ncbi:molecular chaperone HtpG [Candidatus Purcelliella pentastirinorum]|uniref:Chaperone protein HtpG n=1 Tax=Candidatus Purcelliella pentastirinorum TaxID=472834 RepID=A0AAX3NB40_9ENTR|nr:molecular chaperone HtpG [Candidatus Purcelliella pentastirinorum]WDI78748.1 molecular chaperone HtpG [Candidatus Purcelliella pentastirinorum]WDR80733.1 molecular chaperone HtpG [Candidatus Purcelliella pentastirinorum]